MNIIAAMCFFRCLHAIINLLLTYAELVVFDDCQDS